jgi:hypothetical protein
MKISKKTCTKLPHESTRRNVRIIFCIPFIAIQIYITAGKSLSKSVWPCYTMHADVKCYVICIGNAAKVYMHGDDFLG